MSSRILRRLQGKDSFIEETEGISDADETILDSGRGGARRKTLPINPYDLLNVNSDSESELKETDAVETPGHISDEETERKKKKKKKKKKAAKVASTCGTSDENYELDIALAGVASTSNTHQNEQDDPKLNVNKRDEKYTKDRSSAIAIKPKNLNANNELKRIFGTKIVETDNNRRKPRGRTHTKSMLLVNPRDNWPPLGKTGISMKVEKISGMSVFQYVHSPYYQKIQQKFLYAVDSLNPDNIATIINSHPYHVDTLIQLSDLYKLNDDLQMAAELNERALYCLEGAFHPLFNVARGNCQLDYRRQENRALFICLFKHLIFVGQRACYQTALELCKFLLSLDFDADPLAVVLCIDFYALRSQNYLWLINAASEWEIKKNLSQLPNFAYSTALAHFYLAEAEEAEDLSVADRQLQEALILFPDVLNLLLDKCSIQTDATVSSHPFFSSSQLHHRPSPALCQLMSLYVHRTYHEWKNSKLFPWLERNVHEVLQRVDSDDPFVKECSERRRARYPSTPRNVLRHIILSDIKEVTATIASDITTPILGFDPLPPLDSVDLYSHQDRERNYEQSPTLSLFFRSLLPNFNVNARQENRHLIHEDAAAGAEGLGQVAENAFAGAPAQAPAAIGDTLRYSVTVLMDAIGLVLANMPVRDVGVGGDNVHANDNGDEDTDEGEHERESDSPSSPNQNGGQNSFSDSLPDLDERD